MSPGSKLLQEIVYTIIHIQCIGEPAIEVQHYALNANHTLNLLHSIQGVDYLLHSIQGVSKIDASN